MAGGGKSSHPGESTLLDRHLHVSVCKYSQQLNRESTKETKLIMTEASWLALIALGLVVYYEQIENNSQEGKADVLVMFFWQHICTRVIHRFYLKAPYIPVFCKSSAGKGHDFSKVRDQLEHPIVKVP